LLECLNILGTAGPSTTNLKTNEKAHRFHEINKDDVEDDNAAAGPSRRNNRQGDKDNGKLDMYFGGGGKKTGMRLSYAGAGYPLTLLMQVYHRPVKTS
jgi:cell cycle checkpoint protein